MHCQRQKSKQFDGKDLLDFPAFMRNFRYTVEKNTEDPIRRLELLLRFTKGEPHELTQNCITIVPPAAGYKRAKDLLQRDYGHPSLLASAYKSKTKTWMKIKPGDKRALQIFYVRDQYMFC